MVSARFWHVKWLLGGLCALFVLIPSVAQAQVQIEPVWVRTFGAQLTEEARAIAIDKADNLYVTGTFYGVVDFDPGPGVVQFDGGKDGGIYILKFDSAGNLLWGRALRGNERSRSNDIGVDDAGNVFVIGDFKDGIDLNPTSGVANFTSEGEEDIFLLKLDTNGEYLWAHTFGGSSSDNGNGLDVDGAGNVIITGNFEKTVDMDPSRDRAFIHSEGSDDIFIAKFSAAGEHMWVKSMGTDGDQEGRDVAVDRAGNAYLTGVFEGRVDFDPGATGSEFRSNGREDIFIVKFSPNGIWQWTQIIGGLQSDNETAIDVDEFGNVYVTGAFKSDAEFGRGCCRIHLSSAGEQDIFLARIDANSGAFVWANRFGSGRSDMGSGIVVDEQGRIYITGAFEDGVDFDPGPGSAVLVSASPGKDDIFVARYDSDGQLQWAKALQGADDEEGRDLVASSGGTVYVIGEFEGVVDFVPDLAGAAESAGEYDAFLIKFKRTVPIVGEPRVYVPQVARSLR